MSDIQKPKSPIEVIKQANTDEPFIIRLGMGRPPRAQCGCGWAFGPSEDLYELGRAAFEHRDETGHQLRKPDEEDNG